MYLCRPTRQNPSAEGSYPVVYTNDALAIGQLFDFRKDRVVVVGFKDVLEPCFLGQLPFGRGTNGPDRMRSKILQNLTQNQTCTTRRSMNKDPVSFLNFVCLSDKSQNCETTNHGASGDLGGHTLGNFDDELRRDQSKFGVRLPVSQPPNAQLPRSPYTQLCLPASHP